MAGNTPIVLSFKLVGGGKSFKALAESADALRVSMNGTIASAQKLNSKVINFSQTAQALSSVANALSEVNGAFQALAQESISFNDAMHAANTMAGKGAAEYAKLKDQVTALSKEVPLAREQLAKGLHEVISGDVPEDNWITFLDKSARASIGGIASLEEVVQVTGTVIKNYGLAWEEAGAIQDKIQLTSKNGVTSFAQLAQALPKVTANAATLGVSVDELLASFATLTGVSGNTAEVSTQLAAVFTALVKPSRQAAQMAQQMGIQFDAAAIKAAGGMSNFLTRLDADVKRYAAASGMLEQEIFARLFGSAEALRALIPLGGELADTFERNTKAVGNSAGTIDAAFNEMSSTSEAMSQKLTNAMTALTDLVGGFAASYGPMVNFAASTGFAVMHVITLTKAITALNWTSGIARVKTLAAGAACLLMGVNANRGAALMRVFRMSLVSTTAATHALKFALRGLLASTLIGAAFVALGFAIEKLVAALDDSADAANETAEGIGNLKEAAVDTAQVFRDENARMVSTLQAKYADLQAQWKALTSQHARIQWVRNNQAAFGELGLKIDGAKDAEIAFVRNTGAAVQAMANRAKAAAAYAVLVERLAELERQKNTSDKVGYQKAPTRLEVKRGARAEDAIKAKYGITPEAGELEYIGAVRGSTGRANTGRSEYLLSASLQKRITAANMANARAAYHKHNEALDTEKDRLTEKYAKDYGGQKDAQIKLKDKPRKGGGMMANDGEDEEESGKKKKGKSKKRDKEKREQLVKNAASYTDLAHNLAIYQKQLEATKPTEAAAIAALRTKIQTTEAAIAAQKDLIEGVNVKDPKTLADYDAALERVRDQQKTASREQLQALLNQEAQLEKGRAALERLADTPLPIAQIRSFEELDKAVGYYTEQLKTADATQRATLTAQLNALDKLRSAWQEEAKAAPLALDKLDTLRALSEAADYYSERQQTASADEVANIQRTLNAISRKEEALKCGITLAEQQKELDNLNALSRGELKVKIRALGFEDLVNKVKELNKLLADTENPLTDQQRGQVLELRDAYAEFGKIAAYSLDTYLKGWEGIKGVGGGLDSVTEALSSNASAWQMVSGLVDGALQIYQGIAGVIGIMKTLTQATQMGTAAKIADTAADTAAATALGATAAAQATTAAAAVPLMASNKALAATFLELATASYFAAHASIPFAGFGIASGFAASAKAATVAMGAVPFAKGGIVSGPTLGLVGEYAGASHNPEVIAPLSELRKHLNAGQTTLAADLRFEVEGRKLVAVLANETRVSSRAGRRTNIKV